MAAKIETKDLSSLHDRCTETIKVNYQTGEVVKSAGIVSAGECSDGCCDYYRCNVCGAKMTVEWPD